MLGLDHVDLTLGANSIFSNLSVHFKENQINVILGPSGCGKSTILKILAGLIKPNQGRILNPLQKIGFVFQEPRLLPWLNVRENILIPAQIQNSIADFEKTADHWIESTGLKQHSQKFPHQLSGGLRMRAAIARALLLQPGLLLMDEPFSALDEIRRETLQDLLLHLQRELKFTLIFVTHSLSEALFLGDHLFIMTGMNSSNLIEKDLNPRWPRLRDGNYLEQVQSVTSFYKKLLKEAL